MPHERASGQAAVVIVIVIVMVIVSKPRLGCRDFGRRSELWRLGIQHNEI
jgi:hypothetical protein